MDFSTFSPGQTIHTPPQPALAKAATWISAEEHRAVIEKMMTTLKQPVGSIAREDSLYLEQQLTDLFGVEVASELDQYRLPHTYGMMAALPHLKRHPEDQLHVHQQFLEAGLAACRSSFGWFTELGQLTPLAVDREKYFVTLQIDLQPAWIKSAKELSEWYKYRKVMVINPVHELAIVGAVGDFGPGNWLQHQFGGSPELVSHLKVWDLESQGKVIVYFINDPENAVPLGPIEMKMKL